MNILQATKKLKKAFPDLYTTCEYKYSNLRDSTLRREKEVYVESTDVSSFLFLKGDSNTDWKELVDRAIDARGGRR